MAKTRRLQTKRYKPVRVANPTSRYHTTRVNPCQSIRLELTNPKTIFGKECDGSFVVKLLSSWLIIEGVETSKNGDLVYHIGVKYDLSDWTSSETYLGDIDVQMDGYDKHHVTIGVVQVARAGCDNVLTVINPHNGSVKIQGHQVLEVICFDSSWNDYEPGRGEASGLCDAWKHAKVDFGDTKLDLLRYEVNNGVGFVEGIYNSYVRSTLRVNPRLSMTSKELVEIELRSTPKAIREHHWWFGFSNESQVEIKKLSDDVYPCCLLNFDGMCTEYVTNGTLYSLRAIKVMLAVHGKNRDKMQSHFPDENTVEWKLEMRKRSEDKSRGVIINPLATEQVDFNLAFNEVTVELVQPSVFWEDLSDEAVWEFHIDEANLSPKQIRFKVIDDFKRNGKKYQRIHVVHNYKPSRAQETKFLGAINIVCKEKEDCYSGRRRLSCWLSPRTTNRLLNSSNASYIGSSTPNSSTYSNTYGGTTYGGSTTYTKPFTGGKPSDYTGKPKVCTVKLEELKVDNDLATFAKAKKMADVVYREETTCGKKKSRSDSSSHNEGNDESHSTSEFPKSYQNDRQECVASGSGDTKKSTNDGRKACPSRNSVIPDLLVYNGEHLQQIVLDFGQRLKLRYSPPGEVIGNIPSEFWTAVPNDNERIMILSHKTLLVGTQLYQEVTVLPRFDRVPRIPGRHPAGAVRMQATNATKVVFIFINVKEGDEYKDDENVPEFRLIEAQNSSQTMEKDMRYVRNWQNHDAIALNPQDTLYIRNPLVSDKWDTKWSMEFRQSPLPGCVLDRLPQLRDKIDLTNPWCKVPPAGNMYTVKPVVQHLPNCNEILNVIAEETKAEMMLIAQLVFTNSNHVDNNKIVTPYGAVSTTYQLERTFGVYMNLKKVPKGPTTITVTDPTEDGELVLRQGDTVVVKIPMEYVTFRERSVEREVESPWFIQLQPDFMRYKGMSRADDRYVFRFLVEKIDEPKPEILRFACNAKQRSFRVEYKS